MIVPSAVLRCATLAVLLSVVVDDVRAWDNRFIVVRGDQHQRMGRLWKRSLPSTYVDDAALLEETERHTQSDPESAREEVLRLVRAAHPVYSYGNENILLPRWGFEDDNDKGYGRWENPRSNPYLNPLGGYAQGSNFGGQGSGHGYTEAWGHGKK